MLVPPSPEELSEGHPIRTPVGEWHLDGREAIFKPIQQALIDKMIIPDRKEQRISAIRNNSVSCMRLIIFPADYTFQLIPATLVASSGFLSSSLNLTNLGNLRA